MFLLIAGLNVASTCGVEDNIAGQAVVTDPEVSFACEYRQLEVAFTWENAVLPDRQYLEISWYPDRWEEQNGGVQAIEITPSLTPRRSLHLAPETIHYWRIKTVVNGFEQISKKMDFMTPACVADFVDEP